ncbi:3341_t:CDS:2 [Entrophospora sp. SA101]|nr:3341_t:CDS:2 [Entrophospora sp. SA101]
MVLESKFLRLRDLPIPKNSLPIEKSRTNSTALKIKRFNPGDYLVHSSSEISSHIP